MWFSSFGYGGIIDVWKGKVLSFGARKREIAVRSYRKFSAHARAGYGPRRDTLSLREARNGSNAANYAAKEPAGFKGSLWGPYPALVCADLSATMKQKSIVTICYLAG